MSIEEDAIRIVESWHAALPLYKDKLPSRGSISAALIVLERLSSSYDLNIDAHMAPGQTQITGLSSKSLKKALNEFGETRRLTAVAGRSNRGGRRAIAELLESMRGLFLEELAEDSRTKVLKLMQRHIVTNFVDLHFRVERVKAVFDLAASTAAFVQGILE